MSLLATAVYNERQASADVEAQEKWELARETLTRVTSEEVYRLRAVMQEEGIRHKEILMKVAEAVREKCSSLAYIHDQFPLAHKIDAIDLETLMESL